MIRKQGWAGLIGGWLLVGACVSATETGTEEASSVRTAPKPITIAAAGFSEPCAGIDWAELQGNLNPAAHPDFEPIPSQLTQKPKIYLRKEALGALKLLAAAANEDGFQLEVISATRTWKHQKDIWNRKWSSAKYMGFEPLERATKILEYSSMPGSSRHHWGTDIDLNALENAYFESGKGLALYEWLTTHASEYGFVQVYGDQTNGRTGYQEEKWHWSYWPMASKFLACYITQPNDSLFTGFDGAEWSDSLRITERYVMGIDAPDSGNR